SRKTWSAMVCAIRNLTRFIWTDVKNGRNILEDVKLYLNIKSSLPGFENLNRLEVITENQKPNTSSFIKKKKQPIIELKPGNITTQLRKKRIEPPIASNIILKPPFPIAFSIHLYQTLWVYSLNLPFQIGVERIAVEVYNPFGYDDSHWVFDVENKSVSIQSMENETANNEVHE
ncbi:5556_t:CDS:2, partial [Gigaspora margarita]